MPTPLPERVDSIWEDQIEPEWLEWYGLTPQQRWRHTCGLWEYYLSIGGSLDPDPDPASPFWSEEERVAFGRSAQPAKIVVRSRSGV